MLLSLLLLLLFIIILLVRFRIKIDLSFIGGENDHLMIHLCVAGICIPLLPIMRSLGRRFMQQFQALLPTDDDEDPDTIREKFSNAASELIKQGKLMFGSFHWFVQEIQELRLHVALSLGDPFVTAISCGALWATVSPSFIVLQNKGRIDNPPDIRIVPDYGSADLRVRLYCIFSFQLGQIIIEVFRNLGESLVRRTRVKEM